jgi:hypothetical protein
MELSAELLFVLGLASSVIVWVLKVAFTDKGKEIPPAVLTTGVYVVSFVLALLFSPVSLPPFPAFSDLPSLVGALVEYLGLILPILAAAVGFATIVYQALLKRILDGIGSSVKAAIKGSDIG